MAPLLSRSWTQQFDEVLYTERTVVHPGSSHGLPLPA
jgi:hypothetical protein